MPTDLLTPTQAAQRLGLSRARIHQWIQDGRLPAERVGSGWVIRAADLERVPRLPRGPKRRQEREDGLAQG